MAALVVLAEIKDYLSITSNTYDGKLANLITFASDTIESYCSRGFSSANVTEYYNGGRSFIFLDRLPVNNVWSVLEYDGSQYVPLVNPLSNGELPNTFVTATSNAADYSVTYSTGQLFKGTDEGSGTNLFSIGRDVKFNDYAKGVKITYNGGFTTIPSDIKIATLDLIKLMHKGMEGTDISRLEGDYNSTMPYSAGFPPHIRRVLDLYRII